MAYQWSTPISAEIGKDKTTLGDGIHTLTHKQVPISWFSGDNLKNLQWNDEKLVLPEELNNSLFGALRAEDAPSFPTLAKPSSFVPPPIKKAKGTVVVQSEMAKLDNFGGHTAKVEQGILRWHIQKDSQLPSVSVEWQKKQEDTVICHRVILFGNTSMDGVTYHSPEQIKAGALKASIPEAHQKNAEAGRLLALELRFGKSSSTDRFCDSIMVCHGQDSANNKDRWRDDNEFLVDMKSGPLTGFDEVVRCLFVLKNFSLLLFRDLDDRAMPCMAAWDPEYRYWEYIMNTACSHGLFWFYGMQPGFIAKTPGAQLGAWNKPENPPPVPFWLVRDFRAHVKKGELLKLEPLEWEGIVQDPTKQNTIASILPNPAYATFLHELSLMRERAHQRTIADIMFQLDREHRTSVKKLAQIGSQNVFRANLSIYAGVKEGTLSSQGDKFLPPTGTTCNLDFKFGDKEVRLRGTVTDALDKPSNVDLVVHCTVHSSFAFLLQSRAEKDGWVSGRSKLTVAVNYESIDRTLSAFKGCMANMSANAREKLMEQLGPHPDVRHFLFGFQPRFAGSIKGLANVKEVFAEYAKAEGIDDKGDIKKVFDWFSFPTINESQRESTLSALQGGKGNLTVIHGPPGTGKSQMLACFCVLAHFVFGAKTVIATPSNTAADAVMDKVLAALSKILAKDPKKTCRVIRFLTTSGTPIHEDAKRPVGPEGLQIDTAGFSEVALVQRELWKTEARYAGYAFHEAKKTFAHANVNGAPSPSQMAAVKWMEMIELARQNVLFGDRAKEFKQADEHIGEEVLRTRCDMLFGTLSSMGREIASSFPANTVVVDECGQANLPEIAIPFHAFSRTVVRAVAAGDDLQLQGMLSSMRSNEASAFTAKSAFREMRMAQDKFSVHLLNIQYRCHPDIYSFSNKWYYDGRVSAASWLSNVTPLDKTVAALMERELGAAKKWNAKLWPRVLAIDINELSAPYPGTTSYFNAYEVHFIKFLRKLLLGCEVSADGAPVTVQDLTMITPYRGQQGALRDALKEIGGSGEEVARSQTLTVAKSQGGECVIGISTFAKNDPGRPTNVGFVSEPANLNVWTTRQQRWHFVVGSFKARHTAGLKLKQLKGNNDKYIAFLNDICSSERSGVTLLRPSDFASWTGFPAALREATAAAAREATAQLAAVRANITDEPVVEHRQRFTSIDYADSFPALALRPAAGAPSTGPSGAGGAGPATPAVSTGPAPPAGAGQRGAMGTGARGVGRAAGVAGNAPGRGNERGGRGGARGGRGEARGGRGGDTVGGGRGVWRGVGRGAGRGRGAQS